MKKYTPYIFPLVVLGIVFMLVFRWYSLRSERMEYSLLGEGVEIENLSQEEVAESLNGVGDYETVDLESQNPEENGEIRYEIKDDKVRFSVMANLPESETPYRVWLKSTDSNAMREIFNLELAKGGYLGSASLPSELLPFEVIVSENDTAEMADDDSLLRGMIESVEAMNEVEVLEEELN